MDRKAKCGVPELMETVSRLGAHEDTVLEGKLN